MKKIKNLAIRLAILGAPLIGLAQPTNTVTLPDVTGKTKSGLTVGNLWTQIGTWVNWIVGFVGVISLICLLYGAVMYMTAGQNEENVKKGKNAVIYGIIGAIVAILAFSIFSFANSFFSNVT